MKILLTGSSGFIGQYFLKKLSDELDIITISLRNKPISDINFKDVDCIVHLAGKAHQMQKIDEDIYFEVNHRLTVALATAAKIKGVQHFIFISTVKVYGDNLTGVVDESTVCQPTDPYGTSKLLAEKELLSIADDDFLISIIRPPLVYGPRVKGNLEKLITLVKMLPLLPFGGINNERSMVFIGNLVALIHRVIITRASGIFIAGDSVRVSTSKLIQTIMHCLGVRKINFTLPKILMIIIQNFKPQLYSRLFESYIIDNQNTNNRLDFVPPYSFDEGIKCMVDSFK